MDKKTAEKLYDACYMKVYSFAMTLAKDKHKAQEITQETFLKAMTTKQTFRGESERYSWLCAIAKNLFIDSTRKASRYQDEPEETLADPEWRSPTRRSSSSEFSASSPSLR